VAAKRRNPKPPEDTGGPVAVLVEDDPQVLQLRQRMLNGVGFVTIGVKTSQEALREVRSGPSIDMVITDVNLNRDDEDDRSGVTLAADIKQFSPDLPIVGYSGLFNEDEISPVDRELFLSYVPRARLGPEELIDQAREWVGVALGYRTSRTRRADFELERLRQKYKIRPRDFETLRSCVPEGSAGKVSGPVVTADELLRRAGYRLRMIQAGEARPRLDGQHATIRRPIIVWLRSDANAVVVEVANFPTLYAHGESEGEAVRQLLLLLDGYHLDFAEPTEEKKAAQLEAEPVKRLRAFLKEIFG
jgi:CheY-like chemotaxis protein